MFPFIRFRRNHIDVVKKDERRKSFFPFHRADQVPPIRLGFQQHRLESFPLQHLLETFAPAVSPPGGLVVSACRYWLRCPTASSFTFSQSKFINSSYQIHFTTEAQRTLRKDILGITIPEINHNHYCFRNLQLVQDPGICFCHKPLCSLCLCGEYYSFRFFIASQYTSWMGTPFSRAMRRQSSYSGWNRTSPIPSPDFPKARLHLPHFPGSFFASPGSSGRASVVDSCKINSARSSRPFPRLSPAGAFRGGLFHLQGAKETSKAPFWKRRSMRCS